MNLPRQLCWRVSVEGMIAGVANRTKNWVRVMYGRVNTLLYERDRLISVRRSSNKQDKRNIASI